MKLIRTVYSKALRKAVDPMPISQAVLLGFIQGLGEFLPISSSGHLVLLSWFIHKPYQGLAFDVALHLGTLIAILAYFWKDWVKLAADGLSKGLATVEGRLFWYLAAASVPAGALGLVFEDQLDSALRKPVIVGFTLIFFAIVLYIADITGRKNRPIEKTGFPQAMFIGLMQSLALIPGVSRSGSTIAAGLFTGMTREAAARFSFLLSTPAIVGAGILKAPVLLEEGIDAPVVIGAAVSAVVGFITIGFLLKFLRRNSLTVFAVYRIILGLAVIVLAITH